MRLSRYQFQLLSHNNKSTITTKNFIFLLYTNCTFLQTQRKSQSYLAPCGPKI